MDSITIPPSLPQPSGKHVVYIRDRQEREEGGESGGQKPTPPKEFLLLALVGIVCCPLFGIIALLKALAVSGFENACSASLIPKHVNMDWE